MNWQKYYPFFRESEFKCRHTGISSMDPEFMDMLLKLRIEFNRPMVITSGYRHGTHPVEARKASTGSHVLGKAADIRVAYGNAFELVELALKHGIRRIGVKQHGPESGRFIHLDICEPPHFAAPRIWTYP